jgi:hypothetical protein
MRSNSTGTRRNDPGRVGVLGSRDTLNRFRGPRTLRPTCFGAATDGQTLAAQDAALCGAGCAKVYSETASGAKPIGQPCARP